MPLVTKKDFAKQCGIKTNALSVYIDRDKVICENDLIDDEDDINVAFRIERLAKAALKSEQIPREETYKEPEPEDELDLDDGDIMSLPTALKRKAHFDAVVQERTATLKDLDIQKKSGESIPTSAVSELISETLRVFAIGYRDLYEREVQKIAAMAGFSAKEIADLRNSGIKNINLTYNNLLEGCKKSVAAIVSEHSVKRNVGEKL